MKTIIKNVPKVELHVHLDGSVRVETVAFLLGIEIKTAYQNMVCDQNTSSLTDYLTKFELPLQAMQTEKNLKKIIKELLEDLKKEHVIYAEIRFAPWLHTRHGLTQKQVVQAILEGAKEISNIKYNFILCCMRNDILNQNKNNWETIEVAKEFLKNKVVALDLAGDEAKYPTVLFEELFKRAKKFGIPYIIHAGEALDYHSIETAIQMGAKRIGHGVSAVQNETVIKQLNEQNILLEICPESNLNTKIVFNKKDHPIQKLFKKTNVSINTDNRTVSDITLTQEYEDMITLFGFTLEDIKTCNIKAIEHAFIKEEEKQILKKQIEEGFYDATH